MKMLSLSVFIKSCALLLLVGSLSSIANADDRRYHKGHHWSSHGYNKHHKHHHRHWRRHHSDHLAGLVVGGIILGAVVHELAKDDSEGNYNRYTYPAEDKGYSYYAGPEVKSYSYYLEEPKQVVEEYLLDRDGNCFSVVYSNGKRILKEQPASSCEY